MLRIATLCGSLREASFTRALLGLAQRQAPPGMEFLHEPLHDVPSYDADLHAMGWPVAVARIRQSIRSADAVLIGTPEYNVSIPGVLKNALDWISLGDDQPFAGKPVGILSSSTGPWGGARVQYDLRRVLLSMDASVMGKPELLVARASGKFDAAGTCTDKATCEGAAAFMSAFAGWIPAARSPRQA